MPPTGSVTAAVAAKELGSIVGICFPSQTIAAASALESSRIFRINPNGLAQPLFDERNELPDLLVEGVDLSLKTIDATG